MDYEPISVALKFGFLAILYLFLFWIAVSARRDLRANREAGSNTTAAPVGSQQDASVRSASSPAGSRTSGALQVSGTPRC